MVGYSSVFPGGDLAGGASATMGRPRSRPAWWLALLLTGLVGWSARAEATAVMFVGDSSCGTSSYGCPVYGSEVNGVGPSALIITDNQKSRGRNADPLNNPMLLILGIPYTGTGSPGLVLPGISSLTTTSTGYSPTWEVGGSSVYPSSTASGTAADLWNSITGIVTNNGGNYSSDTQGSVYQFIGLTQPGNASEKFSNWRGAEAAANNINVNHFAIGVYQLTNTGMGSGQAVTVNFAAAGLPFGTFAIAYDCAAGGTDSPTDTTGACTPTGNVYATPFTQSAMVTNGSTTILRRTIPAPGSLVLLATSLGILKGTRHRARAKRKSNH